MYNIIRAYFLFFMKKLETFIARHDIIFGVLQFAFFFYVLLGLAYLANSFLLPFLQKIVKKYKLPPSMAGFCIAIGNSIPELSTNLLSCLSDKPEMIGFGFGAIVGSGIFDFTICLGAAAFCSYYFHKRSIKFEIQPLKRDLGVYVGTLFYLVYVFWDHRISVHESLILVCFLPVYLLYINSKATIGHNVSQKAELQTKKMQVHRSEYYQSRYNIFHESNKKYFSYSTAYDVFDDGDSEFNDDEEEEEGEELMENPCEGIRPNYYQQHKLFNSALANFLEDLVDKFYAPWKKLFIKTIHIEKSPILAFCVIMFYCFLITRYTIHTVDSMIGWFNVSHAFIGLTLVPWGGNIGDAVNATVAAKNRQTELMTSTIIGSQIFNLQICLGVPWLLTNLIYGEIVLKDPTIYLSILVVLVVVGITFVIITLFKFKLNYGLGTALVFTYAFYAVFEYVQTSTDVSK